MYESSAERYGLDPAILAALIKQESGGNPQAIGDRGNSFGLGQFNTRGALADFGLTGDQVLGMSAEQQADLTAKFLAQKIQQAGGDVWAGVKRYNGGGDPNYIQNVQRHMPGFRRAEPDVRMAGGDPTQMVTGDPRSGRMNPQTTQLPPFPQMERAQQAGPSQSLMNPLIALVAGLAAGGGGFRNALGNAGSASSAMQTAENDLYELRTKRERVNRQNAQEDSLSRWFDQVAKVPGMEEIGAVGRVDPGLGVRMYSQQQQLQSQQAQRQANADAYLAETKDRAGYARILAGYSPGSAETYGQPVYTRDPGAPGQVVPIQYGNRGGVTQGQSGMPPLAQDPYQQRQLEEEKNLGAELGAEQAAFEKNYPNAIVQLEKMENTVNRMAQMPGREKATGWQSNLPITLGGSDASNYEATFDQFKGQNFLAAIPQMTGMGALSNAEGDAIRAAQSEAQLSQSDEQHKWSLARMAANLNRAKERMRTRKFVGKGVEVPEANEEEVAATYATMFADNKKPGFSPVGGAQVPSGVNIKRIGD